MVSEVDHKEGQWNVLLIVDTGVLMRMACSVTINSADLGAEKLTEEEV